LREMRFMIAPGVIPNWGAASATEILVT
jgi:hypothetical protein